MTKQELISLGIESRHAYSDIVDFHDSLPECLQTTEIFPRLLDSCVPWSYIVNTLRVDLSVPPSKEDVDRFVNVINNQADTKDYSSGLTDENINDFKNY